METRENLSLAKLLDREKNEKYTDLIKMFCYSVKKAHSTILGSLVFLLIASSARSQQTPDASTPEDIAAEPDDKTQQEKAIEQDAGAPPEPYDSPSEVVPPRLLHFESAPYPSQAQKQGLEASVVLQIEVGLDGKVKEVQVRETAGNGFDEAAVAAAKRFVFEPATRGGSPVAARILYRYEFKLEAEPAKKSVTVTEKGGLRGRIVTEKPEKPVVGAEVRIRKGGGAILTFITTADGTWTAPDLEPGQYHVEVAATGYTTIKAVERVEPKRVKKLQYALQSRSEPELEVTVHGDALHREVAHYELSRVELVRVPGTLGDSVHAVEALPSVARASNPYSGDLIIRGSLAENSKVFVDGTWVPRVFHFGSLASIIPSEMIETLEFYPSNFSVRFGRATGGVIDLGFRLINPDGKYHGSAQVDFINARANVEGPVPFTDTWRFMAGIRSSYLDLWLVPVLRDSDSSILDVPRYYDYQIYTERRVAQKGLFRLGFFGAHDQDVPIDSNAEPIDRDNNFFWHLQPHLRLPLTSDLDLTASGSIGRVSEFKEDFFYGVRDFTAWLAMLRTELALKTGTFGIARIGTDILYAPVSIRVLMGSRDAEGQLASISTGSPRLEIHHPEAYYFRPAAFAEYEWTPGDRLSVTAGTRFDYTKDTKQTDIAPRLGTRYILFDKPLKTVLKGGVGLFFEPPMFEYTLPELGFEDLRSSRAIHSTLGVEQSLSERVTLSVEGFEKEVDRIVYGHRDGTGGVYLDNSGSARMYGVDLLLRYEPDERFFGWIAYTISHTKYNDLPDTVIWRIHNDQPHVLNIVGSYRLGRGWEVGGRFRFYSGFLYSSCTAGMLNNSTGRYICYGPMVKKRLDPFHQLDIRVEKMWTFNDFRLSVYLDLINAYFHNSPDLVVPKYDLSGYKPLSKGLPILPSIGVRGEL